MVMGASQLAKAWGVSSLVVGLTIVAFGTSAPEIGITVAGVLRSNGELVIGNIIGSNIFNILLVLGIGALCKPLIVKRRLIWWDVPIMIFVSALLWIFAIWRKIGRIEGGILFLGIIAYSFFAFCFEKKQPQEKYEIPFSPQPLWLQFVWIVVGLVLLGVGAELLVVNATKIALYLGISELLIGLTLVAVGSSLPELATTLMALYKKETDIGVGNIVGSNIFNILCVVGIGGLVSPTPIPISPKAFSFDIPIMFAVSVAALPIFLSGHRISRWEGFLFLFYYLFYLAFLFVEARYIHYLPYFTTAFFFFILPFTILSVGIGVYRHFKKR